MAGHASKDSRLIVGGDEITKQLAQVDGTNAVQIVDDSNLGEDDDRSIAGQITRGLTASGRWEKDLAEKFIEDNLGGGDVWAAYSPGAGVWHVAEYVTNMHTVTTGIGSRVGLAMGFQLGEDDDWDRALQLSEAAYPNLAGPGPPTQTEQDGPSVDFAEAAAARSRRVFVYQTPTAGDGAALEVAIQTRAAANQPWATVHTFNFDEAAVAADGPATDAAEFALSRFVRVRLTIVGTGEAGSNLVMLES